MTWEEYLIQSAKWEKESDRDLAILEWVIILDGAFFLYVVGFAITVGALEWLI